MAARSRIPGSFTLVALGIGCAGAGAGPIVSQPVWETGAGNPLKMMMPDKIVGDYVFGAYGLNALGAGGGFDTGAKFLGLSFDDSDSLGGITSVCDPTGLTGCADFGLKATVWGHGKFGAEYRLSGGGGALDVRVPMRAVLDLPYDAAGGGAPTLGAKFTIGSSWTTQPKLLSQPGSPAKPITPLLAAHGASVSAYADLIAELGAGVSGKICAGACWSDATPKLEISKRLELGSVNRDGNGQFRVLGNAVNPSGSAMGGIIQYELKLPKLAAQDKTLAPDGLAGLLQTQAQDRVVQVKLGIDELVSKVTGIPLSGSVGFDAFGEHIGANYALVEASAGIDTLLAQRVRVQAVPVVQLKFASPVQQYLGTSNGVEQYGAATQSLAFNLGESITLRNSTASLLGGEASFGMMLVVTSDLELQLVAKASVEALKASTTLGGIGPLFGPESVSAPIGTIALAHETFATGLQELGGAYFNLLFQPPLEALPFDPQSIAVVGAFDAATWKDANGNPTCGTRTTPACTSLAQTKFVGAFDLGDAPLPPCLFAPDGCSPGEQQELAERLQLALAAGPLDGQWRESALRLLDDEGHETFLSGLYTLDETRLDIGPGLDGEQFAREAAMLLASVGTQRLYTPPIPEPGTMLLFGLGLAAIGLRRRRH